MRERGGEGLDCWPLAAYAPGCAIFAGDFTAEDAGDVEGRVIDEGIRRQEVRGNGGRMQNSGVKRGRN